MLKNIPAGDKLKRYYFGFCRQHNKYDTLICFISIDLVNMSPSLATKSEPRLTQFEVEAINQFLCCQPIQCLPCGPKEWCWDVLAGSDS